MVVYKMTPNGTFPDSNRTGITIKTELPDNRVYHGYISGIICLLGILGNICNVVVWLKGIPVTSTNILLSALAIADMTSLFFYLIYAVYFFIFTAPYELYGHSRAGIYLVLLSFHLFISFATVSCWITISIAIFRYIKVCQTSIAGRYCNKRRAKLTISLVFTTFITTTPFYFYYEVCDKSISPANSTRIWLCYTSVARDEIYQMISLWLYGVLMKVTPSCGLIGLSFRIFLVLRRAKLRKQKLNQNASGYHQTTLMLLTIVMIYIINQLSVGIAALISGIRGGESQYFYFMSYSRIGDTLELITLLNSALNFVVYMLISEKYRKHFKKVVPYKCANTKVDRA